MFVRWRTMVYSRHCDNYVVVLLRLQCYQITAKGRLFSVYEAGCKLFRWPLMVLSHTISTHRISICDKHHIEACLLC